MLNAQCSKKNRILFLGIGHWALGIDGVAEGAHAELVAKERLLPTGRLDSYLEILTR